MTVTESPGEMKRFRRATWRFQATFETPLGNLEEFVATIVSTFTRLEGASIAIDNYVFEPKRLSALLSAQSLPATLKHDCRIDAGNGSEVAATLRAALSDWVDFAFTPVPKPFVIYADHDEYITFFASSKSNLNRVAIPLIEKGFRQVHDYERRW
jgi:hypothetical protein